MNELTVGHVTDVADLLTHITEASSDAEVTDLLYPNTLGSYIEHSNKLDGWLGRMTNRSFEAWLARGGIQNTVE